MVFAPNPAFCLRMSSEAAVALRIRRVDSRDRRLLWEWANDIEVRTAAFNGDPIPWANHVSWFQERLSSDRCRIFVITEADGTPVGQVRFERPEDASPEAEIDFSIALSHRGRGLGTEVLRLACQEYQRENHLPVIGHVKPSNQRSMKIFERAGFIWRGGARVRGIEAVRWELLPPSLEAA